jgi:hypothetical protein
MSSIEVEWVQEEIKTRNLFSENVRIIMSDTWPEIWSVKVWNKSISDSSSDLVSVSIFAGDKT